MNDESKIRDCLLSIMSECEGYRFGQSSYDIKLDHIYEVADVALQAIDRLQRTA